MRKSVCILGAGIGGLTAGAYLAIQGYKVTVLEKATTVGGSAGWYVRNKRHFPTGATIAFGLEEQGIMRMILDELEIKLQTEVLSHPMDVILPDRRISIYQDSLRWEAELQKKFPERCEDIVRFWRNLTEISETVIAVTKHKISLPIQRLEDIRKLSQFVIHHPFAVLRLIRYALCTVEDLMKKHSIDDYIPFRQFLNAQLLDAAQTDIKEAALLPSSVALSIYRYGSFHVLKGLGEISKAIAARIETLGGSIVLASPVHSIKFESEKRMWRVESRKRSEMYDIVLNNTGVSIPSPTMTIMDENKSFSWGAFRVDAILKGDSRKELGKEKRLPFALQIVPQLFGDDEGPVYVTFHDAYDQKGNLVEDELLMTASIHTDPKQWRNLTKELYIQRKEEVTNAIVDEIERVFPVRNYLLSIEGGTPLTYKKFIGKEEVGGFPLTVKNAILKPRGTRSSHPSLYLVGERIFPGPGTLSSALSGYYAARTIQKEHPVKKRDA